MSVTPSIFISYSHSDKVVAQAIAEQLEAAGAEVWIDEREFRVGDSIVERLAGAIEGVHFVAAIVSQDSVRSSWCEKELSWAVTDGLSRNGIKVLPLRLGDVETPAPLKDVYFLPIDPNDPGAIADRILRDARSHLKDKVVPRCNGGSHWQRGRKGARAQASSPSEHVIVLDVRRVNEGGDNGDVLTDTTALVTRTDVTPNRVISVRAEPLLPFETRESVDSPLAELIDDTNAPVEIHHPPDLASICWEAAIEASAPGGWPRRVVWRRVKGPTKKRRLRYGVDWPVFTSGLDPRFSLWDGSHDRLLEHPKDDNTRIVHLKGLARQTSGGVVGIQTNFEPGAGDSKPTTARDMVLLWPALELVVLQGLGSIESEALAREQAALFRQLGSDLVLNGAASVVVIPGAAGFDAIMCVDSLVTSLNLKSTTTLTSASLATSVAAVRHRLAGDATGGRKLEIALDVCLFLGNTITAP